MDRIGVRELRQHASRFLKRVAAGETIEVTDRGVPVAHLVPVKPSSSTLDRLIREGRARAADLSIDDLGPPLKPRVGVPLPSEVLQSLRENER